MRIYRTLFLAFLSLSAGGTAYSQYYVNQFPSYVLTPQQQKDAASWGEKAFKEALAKIKQQQQSDPNTCISNIYYYLLEGDMANAMTWSNHLKKIDKGLGHLHYGFVCEMWNMPSTARKEYQSGIDCGNEACVVRLHTLKRNGPMTREQRDNTLAYLRRNQQMASFFSMQAVNNMSSGSSGSYFVADQYKRIQSAKKLLEDMKEAQRDAELYSTKSAYSRAIQEQEQYLRLLQTGQRP